MVLTFPVSWNCPAALKVYQGSIDSISKINIKSGGQLQLSLSSHVIPFSLFSDGNVLSTKKTSRGWILQSFFFFSFFFFTKGKANAPQRFLLGKHLKNLNIPITEKVYIFLLQPGDLIGWVKWRDVTQKDTWTGRNADVCQSRRTKKCCCYERNRGRGRSWESKLWRPSFLPFGSRHRLLHLIPSREGSAVLGGHFPRTQHPEEGKGGFSRSPRNARAMGKQEGVCATPAICATIDTQISTADEAA